MAKVAVIDYGLGNLLSVRRGLEHCGADVLVTSEHDQIKGATHVVLPGVGAFGNAMEELQKHNLVEVVREVAAAGTPLLGICLGMQLLLESSDEFGHHEGLGLIKGRVLPVPNSSIEGQPLKVPHIGWNDLETSATEEGWQSTVLEELSPGEAVYFVHSFMGVPESPAHRLADCFYGGHRVAAVIGAGNVVGCQFHPEKSGAAGLKILSAFCAH